jgi:hypothetical protein
MEDVLEVYERPYNPEEPVICLDEKPVTLHAEVRSATPAVPGREARRDSEYKRCGTANVFCAVEPKAGHHFAYPTHSRHGYEFAQVLFRIALAYPEAKTIHLVMDNLSTHTQKSLTDFYGKGVGGQIWERYSAHYTPTHGSWLNQAEIEISLYGRQCLGKRRFSNLAGLRRETTAWRRRANKQRIKINWNFTRKKARRKFKYKSKCSKRSKN